MALGSHIIPSDISGIDTRVVCHRLTINSYMRPISQRNHKVGKEKRATIDEDVNILSNVDFITEVKKN